MGNIVDITTARKKKLVDKLKQEQLSQYSTFVIIQLSDKNCLVNPKCKDVTAKADPETGTHEISGIEFTNGTEKKFSVLTNGLFIIERTW